MTELVTVSDLKSFKQEFKDEVTKDIHREQNVKLLKLSRIMLELVSILEVDLLDRPRDHGLQDGCQKNDSFYSTFQKELVNVKNQIHAEFISPYLSYNTSEGALIESSFSNSNDAEKSVETNINGNQRQQFYRPPEGQQQGSENYFQQLSEQFLVNISGLNSNLQNLENFLIEGHNLQNQPDSETDKSKNVPKEPSDSVGNPQGPGNNDNSNSSCKIDSDYNNVTGDKKSGAVPNLKYISISHMLNDSYTDNDNATHGYDNYEHSQATSLLSKDNTPSDKNTIGNDNISFGDLQNSSINYPQKPITNHDLLKFSTNSTSNPPLNNLVSGDYLSLSMTSQPSIKNISALLNDDEGEYEYMSSSAINNNAAAGKVMSGTLDSNSLVKNSNTAQNVSLPSLQESINPNIFQVLKKRKIGDMNESSNDYEELATNVPNFDNSSTVKRSINIDRSLAMPEQHHKAEPEFGRELANQRKHHNHANNSDKSDKRSSNRSSRNISILSIIDGPEGAENNSVENSEILENGREQETSILNAEAKLATLKKKNVVKPLYDFAPVKSVRDLLEEYFHGLEGRPSIKSLETQYGARWRGGSKHSISKKYNRRKFLYNSVERAIADPSGNFTLDKCVDILEWYRTFQNSTSGAKEGEPDKGQSGNFEDKTSFSTAKVAKKSLHWLACNLPVELLKYLAVDEVEKHNKARDHEW